MQEAPPPALPGLAPAGAQVRIIASVALPNGIQLWVVADQGSARALAGTLGGKSLILTLENVTQMWQQVTQQRIVVPHARLMPKGD